MLPKGIEKIMKSHKREMLEEYDFSQGIRGKYAKCYAQGTNFVALSTDVAKVFHDSKSVNEALRVLTRIARKKSFVA